MMKIVVRFEPVCYGYILFWAFSHFLVWLVCCIRLQLSCSPCMGAYGYNCSVYIRVYIRCFKYKQSHLGRQLFTQNLYAFLSIQRLRWLLLGNFECCLFTMGSKAFLHSCHYVHVCTCFRDCSLQLLCMLFSVASVESSCLILADSQSWWYRLSFYATTAPEWCGTKMMILGSV